MHYDNDHHDHNDHGHEDHHDHHDHDHNDVPDHPQGTLASPPPSTHPCPLSRGQQSQQVQHPAEVSQHKQNKHMKAENFLILN